MPPTRYGWEDDHVLFAIVTETRDPDSYMKVIEGDDHDKWITTMEKEMESLGRNQTWTLVDLSKDSKIIGCTWVFHKKDNEQYKVRLLPKDMLRRRVLTTMRFSLL